MNLHGSTTLSPDMFAATTLGDEVIDIALNLNYLKTEDEVVKAVAHEIAHVLADSAVHGAGHRATWNELEKKMLEQMK